MAASHGQIARGLSEIVLGAFPLLFFISPIILLWLETLELTGSLERVWGGSGALKQSEGPEEGCSTRAWYKWLQAQQLPPCSPHMLPPHTPSPLRDFQPDVRIWQAHSRAALQACEAIALAPQRLCLQVRCTRSRYIYPHLGCAGCRPGATELFLHRASKRSYLISPKEALSSAPCQSSGYSLPARADLHPASQERGGIGVIPPTKPHRLVWGMTCAGRRLCARVSRAAVLAACAGRASDEGAWAAAASPSMRPGVMKNALKLHTAVSDVSRAAWWHYSSIIVHCRGVNCSLCNFYLT